MTNILDEICKDFAIVYADAERALNLVRGLDEKFREAMTTIPYSPGDADEYNWFHELKRDCHDAIKSVLDQFDSPFAQNILSRADKAIAGEPKEEEEAIAEEPPHNPEIHRPLLELSHALGEKGIPGGHQLQQPKGLQECLKRIAAIAQENRLEQKRQHRILQEALRKIQLLALPLMRISLAADFQDADGNSNEDKDTLAEASIEILEVALREIREANLPF